MVAADLRLADLCIFDMDAEGARAYLTTAESTIVREGLTARTGRADLQYYSCWEAIIVNDLKRATKAAKDLRRILREFKQGTAHHAVVSTGLATFRGTATRESTKDFLELKSIIGTKAHASTEQHYLAALLLFSRAIPSQDETAEFVRSQFARIESSGREVWPFLKALL
jgi:hypothetical protein